MLRNTSHSWGAPAKLLHWFMAALIFTQFVLGWTAVSWRLSPTQLNLFVWHKSIGILILTLVTLRILWRLANPTPILPVDMPSWERTAARASHVLLYVLMVVTPLTGWVINSAANIPFRVFWLISLPNITAPDKTLEELVKIVHLSLFIIFAAALAVHIAAALRHHFVKRNDTLIRMLPDGNSRI